MQGGFLQVYGFLRALERLQVFVIVSEMNIMAQPQSKSQNENDEELRKGVESVGFHCEQTTSELADVLIDKTENDKILKDIFDTRISKN